MPDLFFLSAAGLHLLERTPRNGVPELVVEVVSPESQRRDREEKFAEYEAAGVLE